MKIDSYRSVLQNYNEKDASTHKTINNNFNKSDKVTGEKITLTKSDSHVLIELSAKSLEYEDELNSMKQFFERMAEEAEEASNAESDLTLANKLKLLSNLIKNIQIMQSNLYTRESYNELMASAKAALSITKKQAPTVAQVNRAMMQIQKSMVSLKIAKKEEKRGKHQIIDEPGELLEMTTQTQLSINSADPAHPQIIAQ